MHRGFDRDKDGNHVSTHRCDTCGVEFTLCPAVSANEPGRGHCLDDNCESYDPHRDLDLLFMSDDEIARDKRVVSIIRLRKRRFMKRLR